MVQYSNQSDAIHALRAAIQNRRLHGIAIPRPLTVHIKEVVLFDKSTPGPFVIVIEGYAPGVYPDALSAQTTNIITDGLHCLLATTREQAYDIWRKALDDYRVQPRMPMEGDNVTMRGLTFPVTYPVYQAAGELHRSDLYPHHMVVPSALITNTASDEVVISDSP